MFYFIDILRYLQVIYSSDTHDNDNYDEHGKENETRGDAQDTSCMFFASFLYNA